MEHRGTLWVVATPIGNLGDWTLRGTETLRNASLVAAEDTRRSRKLLTHLGISKPLLRCDAAREAVAAESIVRKLAAGDSVAFLTDAGTPLLSDPGNRLVARVHEAGFPVVPIPGPSAITAALSASGFPAERFRFIGFMPRKSGARRREIDRMVADGDASVFFESPYRLRRTLEELAELAPERPACVAREITKAHEEIVRAPLAELRERFARKNVIGECTVVVSGLPKKEARRIRRRESTMGEE